MTDIALFHSVLGVRSGVREAADRLRAEGHDVVVVDQYGGRAFDDYNEADEFAQSIGHPTLMGLAEEAVQGVPDGFIAAGFCNGGGMADFVATKRPVRGVLMLSGALDLARLGAEAWLAGMPAQIHYTTNDPFRNQTGIDAVIAQVRAAERAGQDTGGGRGGTPRSARLRAGQDECHRRRRGGDAAQVSGQHGEARLHRRHRWLGRLLEGVPDWFVHEPHPVSGSGHDAHELLPAVHRVASLCKRWLLGTHQGGVLPEHTQSYLEEFCFRFNRRHSRACGLLFYRLLQYAAGAPPLTYRQLVANPRPKAIKPPGLAGPRSRPGSLAQPPEDRPWRAAERLD